MTDEIDDLAAIFLDVSEEGTLTESQEESHSHAPTTEGDDLPDLTRDGLADAVDEGFAHSDAGG